MAIALFNTVLSHLRIVPYLEGIMSCSSISNTISNASLCEKITALVTITLFVGGIITATQFPVGTGQFYAGFTLAAVSPLFLIGLVISYNSREMPIDASFRRPDRLTGSQSRAGLSGASSSSASRPTPTATMSSVQVSARKTAFEANKCQHSASFEEASGHVDLFQNRVLVVRDDQLIVRHPNEKVIAEDVEPLCSVSSPNGKLYVLGCSQRKFTLFSHDLTSLEEYQAAGEKRRSLLQIKFTNNGTEFVTVTGNIEDEERVVQVWDTQPLTARSRFQVTGCADRVVQDIDPETGRLLMSQDNQLTLSTGQLLAEQAITKALFLPNGRSVLYYGEGESQLHVVDLKDRLRNTIAEDGVIKDMAFSPDGNLLVVLRAAAQDYRISVINVADWQVLQVLTHPCQDRESAASIKMGCQGDIILKQGEHSFSYFSFPPANQ